MHRPKPSRRESGADGVPITRPLPVATKIRSERFRCALAPLTLALSKVVRDRFGSEARPASVPMMSGVSWIHSAVRCVDVYERSA